MEGPEGSPFLLGGRPVEELDRSRGGGGRHRVVKASFGGIPVVVKCYGPKAGPVRTAFRRFGSRFLVGKSSVTPVGRRETERAVLRLWRREGFDVPALVEEAAFPELEGTPYLVMEWIEGPTLERFLADPSVPPERKEAAVARFAPILARRHARALALGEPALLFENPTFNHVFLSGDRLVHHDFEIVFRRRRGLERLVRREIVGFLCSLAKAASGRFPSLLRVLVEGYPDRGILARTAGELARYGGIPLFPWLGPLTMLLHRSERRRRRAPVATALERVLE